MSSNDGNTTDATAFQLPGHYVYDGQAFNGTYILPENLEKIKSFTFRDEDVSVVTYPKAGTTWMQQIVYLIQTSGDIESSRNVDINVRFPFIEWQNPGEQAKVDTLSKAPPGQRFIKAHLGPTYFKNALSHKNAKIVIVMRNVKDNLVSYYNFYKNNAELGSFKGTFTEYMQIVKDRDLMHGDWFDFNLDWWQFRDHSNVHFVKFEDMIHDIRTEVIKLAKFLGKELSDDLLDIVLRETSFNVMKDNTSVNRQNNDKVTNFMRKGQIGDWKNWFDEGSLQWIEQEYEQKMKGSSLTFNDGYSVK